MKSQIKKQIILASKSPWRKRLMARHGIKCRIHGSSFNELKSHKNPRTLVLWNARGKAMEVARHYQNAVIIGVDTVGVLEGKILGKPRNRAHAASMLWSLRGKRHRVVTGLCIVDTRSGKIKSAAETTWITFRKFSDDELERYLDSGQWKGKAGSYAIQGRAKSFVEKIAGDITNVVGLPMKLLKRIL